MPHNIIKHYKTDNNYNINSGVTKILFMIFLQKSEKLLPVTGVVSFSLHDNIVI